HDLRRPAQPTSSHLHDRACEFEPTCLACPGEMIDTVPHSLRLRRTANGDIETRPCDIACRGGAAALISDYSQTVALCAEAQNCRNEVPAKRTVDPRCAENNVLRIGGADAALARELATAIDV